MNRERGDFASDEKVISNAIYSYTSQIQEKYGDKIKRVILFGSWARGEGDSGSDVDLLVITSKLPVKSKLDIMWIACSFFTKTNVYLSIKVFSEDEFEQERDFSFIKTVLMEGRQIA
ncbi:nucleotidyltransferase domain-containing protein [Methanospirillum stamsii]|uniref:Nucleotidyltransferase domain-containing protein n=1 Tax=Methanospirillum stamsii TaxID=1277351 RepID=A0A2V2NLH7_9EURY|nr:nucleotidyltransferase domain-containing protein [Methanospirillum stamsii]PWR76173.1 nucleotidyltransferase domain-containing protein [Methanospirillum stamsii]